jgi:hypothetical protein
MAERTLSAESEQPAAPAAITPDSAARKHASAWGFTVLLTVVSADESASESSVMLCAADVDTSEQLTARHPLNRKRLELGANYRAEVWYALERGPQATPA